MSCFPSNSNRMSWIAVSNVRPKFVESVSGQVFQLVMVMLTAGKELCFRLKYDEEILGMGGGGGREREREREEEEEEDGEEEESVEKLWKDKDRDGDNCR